jgi:hypothetical protein
MNKSTNQPLMPALRQALTSAEPLALVFHEKTGEAQRFLALLDQIHDLAAQCTQAGLEIASEQVRIVALNARAMRDAERFMRAYGDTPIPPDSYFGPQLRDLALHRQKNRSRSIASTIAVIMVIIGIMAYIIWTTPESANTTLILNAVISDDHAKALQIAQEQAQKFPTDSETLVWLSVLSALQGEQSAAQAAWQSALKNSENPDSLIYLRGNDLLLVGEYDQASADATTLQANPTTHPEGLFLAAGVAEAQGDVKTAIELMRKTADAAEAAGRAEFAVMARIRMGGLMQYGIPKKP